MIRPPIIIDARGEVLLFRDVQRAEAYLEAIDVRNGEYAAAYDSEGKALALGTKVVERRVFFGLLPVKIEVANLSATVEQADCALQLEDLLRKHVFNREGDDVPDGPLAVLVSMAIERQGFTA